MGSQRHCTRWLTTGHASARASDGRHRHAGAVVILLAVSMTTGFGDATPEGTAAPAPASPAPAALVKMASPRYRERMTALETTGKIQFDEDQLVRVHAPLTGRVLEVLARPGDVVEAGQRLLVMESPDLPAARTDYAKAVADADRASAALDLTRELFALKAIAAKEIREAENDHKKALAERARAAARLVMLGVAEDQLPRVAAREDVAGAIVVTAPRSGVIVERNASPGQVVAYGQSDTPVNLFLIADLGTMWAVADVYEPDVARVAVGQSVAVVRPCCPGEPVWGRVTYISDVVDRETRTVKVRAVVPNPGRALKAEMFVRITIATGAVRHLVLPKSAIHRDEGQTYVLVSAGPGAYARRRVRLGDDLDGLVEVLDRIGPGDRVAAEGSILLKPSAVP